MAFKDRRPVFNLSGTLRAGVSAVATSISSDVFTDLPTIYNSETYLPLVIADDSAGTAEVVYVTDHAAASNTVTIARKQEGTTARAWNAGSVVRCAPTVEDVQRVYGYLRMTTNANIPTTAGVVPLDISLNTVLSGGMTAASNGLVVPVSGYYDIRIKAYVTSGRAWAAAFTANSNGQANRFVDIQLLKSVANSYDISSHASQIAFLNAGDRVNMNYVLAWYDSNQGIIAAYGSTSAAAAPTSLEVVKL